MTGTVWKTHLALSYVATTRDTPKLRVLTGAYQPYYRLARDQGTNDSNCRLCSSSCEDTRHILTECQATSNQCEKLLPELLNTIASIDRFSEILDLSTLTIQVLKCVCYL